MRFALAASCVVLLLAVAAVALALGEKPKVDHPLGFQVVRVTGTTAGQLIVYLPTEVERPSMTSDSVYLSLDCFDVAGRRLLRNRLGWPSDSPYHFHLPVPTPIARGAKRCQLSGMPTTFEATVIDGPKDGSHPVGPPAPAVPPIDPLKAM